MSKLSEPLKALINASHARPHTVPAPRQITSVYDRIAKEAAAKHVGLPAWLTFSTAATMTMNSPDSLLALYTLATSPQHQKFPTQDVYTAELMREIGLKCIGLNGVPRTINCLGAFYGGLPQNIQQQLSSRPPRRALTSSNIESTLARGRWMWNDIYTPFTDKLTSKLGQSHPDLPVHIIESEYGALFTDPITPSLDPKTTPNVGRVLTSIMAIAVLRSQTGVGPQVVSHVFGLRKAFESGSAESDEEIQGGKWLSSDEGSLWLLKQIDGIVEAIGEGKGTSFAQGFEKAKL